MKRYLVRVVDENNEVVERLWSDDYSESYHQHRRNARDFYPSEYKIEFIDRHHFPEER